MQLNSINNPIQICRQVAIREWMTQGEGRTFRAFGKAMGITGNGARRLLFSATMPIGRYNQFVAAFPDFPRELLPEPRNLPPGPKPKLLQDPNAA